MSLNTFPYSNLFFFFKSMSFIVPLYIFTIFFGSLIYIRRGVLKNRSNGYEFMDIAPSYNSYNIWIIYFESILLGIHNFKFDIQC